MPPKGPKVDHRNTEALDGSPATEASKPRRPAKGRRGRGASHVVGERESRAQGEGRQEVGTLPESEERSVDADQQADKAWLLDVQRKLYQWSRDNPAEAYRKLWNWVTDPRNLRCAWRRAASNKGKRSAGTDGMTVARICRTEGEAKFIDRVREELRSGSYRPSPGRRKLIPKPGKPGAFRPLAIPTVADRVVQGAIKQILEPIFEAQFWPVSYGFRPGRGCHGALEHLRITTTPRAKAADGKTRQAPYSWIIEGDIKDCFGQISHHALMKRLRRRVADRKVTRLVLQFLKAGVLDEEQFIRTPSGTPQGGVISPLLANIALSAVEERYERWVYPRPTGKTRTDGMTRARRARGYDRLSGRLVCFPIRYADDFVILVHGSREQAEAEKNALAEHLRMTLGLELSAEKTRTIPITEEFVFLGHRIRLKWDRCRGYYTALEVPKVKAADLRHRVKTLTGRSMLGRSLAQMLTQLNRTVRGWSYFYRHCHGAGRVFHQLDWYVDGRVWRWLKKKHGISTRRLLARFKRRSRTGRRNVWQEAGVEQFLAGAIRRGHYLLGWLSKPDYAMTSGEPDA